MQTSKSLLPMLLISAVMAAGQASAPGPDNTKAGTSAAAKPAAVSTTRPVAPAAAAAFAAKPAAKKVVRKPSSGEKRGRPAAASAISVAAKQGKSAGTGKRDPFVSIIQAHSGTSPVCSTGKQCLVVDQVVLKGIVRWAGGMMAVVENNLHKPYFLKENDPVFNGEVVKITSDSIVFREKVVDKAGREGSREIVKRLNRPA
jgi:hypothetical protein